MIRVISSFADGPANFHSTGPAEDQIQKLISSTDYHVKVLQKRCHLNGNTIGKLELHAKKKAHVKVLLKRFHLNGYTNALIAS